MKNKEGRAVTIRRTSRVWKVAKRQRMAVVVVGRTEHRDWGYAADGSRMVKVLEKSGYKSKLLAASLACKEWQEEWDGAFEARCDGIFRGLPRAQQDTSNLPSLRHPPPATNKNVDQYIICLFNQSGPYGEFTLGPTADDVLTNGQLECWVEDLVQAGWKVGLLVVCCHAPALITKKTTNLLLQCDGFAVIADGSNAGFQSNYFTETLQDMRYGSCLMYRLFDSLAKQPLRHVLTSVKMDYDHEDELPANPKFIGPENFPSFFGDGDTVLCQPSDVPLVPLQKVRRAAKLSGVPRGPCIWPVLNCLLEFVVQIDSLEKHQPVTLQHAKLKQDNGPFYPDNQRAAVLEMYSWLLSKNLINHDFHGGFYPTAFVMCGWDPGALEETKLAPVRV